MKLVGMKKTCGWTQIKLKMEFGTIKSVKKMIFRIGVGVGVAEISYSVEIIPHPVHEHIQPDTKNVFKVILKIVR